ncbi:uncharacterized protein LOC118195398 [Stegodyphus dumicola]|uniref:uncharacterized protein LOC118195398 n=1 Tax=Stegodyphus dumicola TaxID=202533 RepID=UPI0015AFFB06|nr:uncharacterized protein LOC118195398 [Stegodyphus dumicola]
MLPKLLLQECWKQEIAWDAKLPEAITKKFLNWQNQITHLKNIFIPRWMTKRTSPEKQCSLHVFADASKNAYAACDFIRIETEESVSCELVRAKNRITPLKAITIPRLELLACLIAANVKTDLKRPDLETHYWTDSSSALSWIKRDEHWTTFVSNTTQEIRDLSPLDDWHHVQGNLNPADISSRGSSVRYPIEAK